MKTMYQFLVAGVLFAAVAPLHALTPQEMTDAERRALPPWCEFTQTFDRASNAPGRYHDHVTRYGPGWTHVHHFCWALASLVRYSRFDTTAQMKETLASSALADIDYVLRNAPDDFVLRFDILARKTRILIMIQKLSEAERLSREIIAEWPNRPESHGLAAEVFLAKNQSENARRVLIEAESLVENKSRLAQIRTALGL